MNRPNPESGPLPALAELLANRPLPPGSWIEAGRALYEGLESGIHPDSPRESWLESAWRLRQMLRDLESRRGIPGLARALSTEVELLIPAGVVPAAGLRTGYVYAMRLDATQPFRDVSIPAGVEMLRVIVHAGDAVIGELVLPACDGWVAREVLADAVSARFAWPLLGRFFGATIYPTIYPAGEDCTEARLHDRIGWSVFLREVWGIRDWPVDLFYRDPLDLHPVEDRDSAEFVRLEVAAPLPDLRAAGAAGVMVTVGGAELLRFRLGAITAPTAPRLIATVTNAAGFDLCRLAVREAVLGRPFRGPGLRTRLMGAARRRALPPRLTWLISPFREMTAQRRRASAPKTALAGLFDDAVAEGLLPECDTKAGAVDGRILYAPLRASWPAAGPPPPGALPRCPGAVTRELPILMYHRVAADGCGPLSRYCIEPTAFEEQIAWLRDAGYHSVGLDHWKYSVNTRQPLPGRAVILTFDDGCREFPVSAWPILKRYGFSAIVFVVTALAGGVNEWDADCERLSLMDWDAIRALQKEGVEIGSHSSRHRALTSLSPFDLVRDLIDSQRALRRELGAPAASIAYPYGFANPSVRCLAGACGFGFGLTAKSLPCRPHDPLMNLPRIEICGGDSLEAFQAKLAMAAAS